MSSKGLILAITRRLLSLADRFPIVKGLPRTGGIILGITVAGKIRRPIVV